MLTSVQISDARRFAGYPVTAALAFQDLGTQGNSVALDGVLAALTADQQATLTNVYLANLTLLEVAIPAMSDGLDVDKAAVYTRNAAEQAERETLFASWRMKLCGFLGVPYGPGIFAGGSSASTAPSVFVV